MSYERALDFDERDLLLASFLNESRTLIVQLHPKRKGGDQIRNKSWEQELPIAPLPIGQLFFTLSRDLVYSLFSI
jgi:hypothetical protein